VYTAKISFIAVKELLDFILSDSVKVFRGGYLACQKAQTPGFAVSGAVEGTDFHHRL